MPIERATEGAVTRRDLRPEDYLIHWPELAKAHTPPAPPAMENVAEAQATVSHEVDGAMVLIPERRKAIRRSGFGRRLADPKPETTGASAGQGV